jgi:hypothetical protein
MNWLHRTIVLIAAFLAVFLEAGFSGSRTLFRAQIDFLPPLMIYAALSTDLMTLTLLAISGGLWFDALSANPLGTTTLPLFLVGLVIWLKRTLLLQQQRYVQFLLGLAAGAIVPVLCVLLLIAMDAQPLIGWSSLWQWFIVTVGSGLLTPVCFRMFDRLHSALDYPAMAEPSFRSDREIKRGRV